MRYVKLRDLLELPHIGAHLLLAWFLPERTWKSVTRGLARVHVRITGERGRHLEGIVPPKLNISTRELEIGFHQHNHWALIENLREYAPWGWRPNIDIIGQEHIERGLEKGKGVILWFSPFVHADIVFKKAIHRAGFRLSHLSSFTHGFSDTRFGVAVLNPIKTRIEARYLKERCVMALTGAGPAIRRLIEHLKANEVVSIAALHTGRRYAERPFLGGTLRLAKGGPNIALTTGATLLPVFVVPSEPGYVVRVEPALVPDHESLEEAEEEIIDAYVPLLERYVSRYPTLWRGWLDPSFLWKANSET